MRLCAFSHCVYLSSFSRRPKFATFSRRLQTLAFFAPWGPIAMVECANASLCLQPLFFWLSVVFLAKSEVCNLFFLFAPVKHKCVLASTAQLIWAIHALYTNKNQWLGYTRPINLNQALYTLYIPQTISSQTRVGEEQPIRHGLMRLQRCSVYNAL